MGSRKYRGRGFMIDLTLTEGVGHLRGSGCVTYEHTEQSGSCSGYTRPPDKLFSYELSHKSVKSLP